MLFFPFLIFSIYKDKKCISKNVCTVLYPQNKCYLQKHTLSYMYCDSCSFESIPASGSFPMSQFFASGGQSIGVSASISVLPMDIQDLFPLGWTGWIFLQSKGLSRVFSNTTAQKHQFFSAKLSLESNSYIHTRLLEKP